MRLMIPRGMAKKFADVMNRSVSLVKGWCRPSSDDLLDTGKQNPIDRLRLIMLTSIAEGVPKQDALAGLHCMAQMFNHVCVPVPVPAANTDDQVKDLLKAMKEIGEWSAETSKALEDGRLKDSERARICKEGYEAIAAIMASLQHSREGTVPARRHHHRDTATGENKQAPDVRF
jgi:hypothetical protein